MNLIQMLRRRVELQPGVPALIDHTVAGDRVIGFSVLNRFVDFISVRLREEKIQPGDHVVLLLEPSQEFYGFFLALLQIGAIPLLYEEPLDHREINAWLHAMLPEACIVPQAKWLKLHLNSDLRRIPKKIFVNTIRFHTRWLRLGKIGAVEEVNGSAQALLSLLQYRASPEALQTIVFWLFGSLARATWPKVGVVALALAVILPVLARDAWPLTALRLGEERARSLGVNVSAVRLRVFASVALLTAVAVSFVGTIGFVGLVAPHVARMLVGEDQRYLLPMSAICGALFLSSASVVSKFVAPGALFPIGIVTSLIGVPCFFALLLRSRRGYW